MDCFGQCSSLSLTSNVNSGCAPLLVTFTVKSAGAGSNFSWDFGNIEVTNENKIQKTFASAGKYPLKLVVTLSNGSVCANLYDTITVLPPPTPQISVSPGQLLCSGRTAIFTDQTSDVSSREWIIDGISYNNASPTITHTFSSPGAKSVSLIVTDSTGCMGTFSDNQYMELYDSAQTDFCADITYTKTSVKAIYTANINAPGRTVQSVSWNFPGGTPSTDTGQSPIVVTYKTPLSSSSNVTMTATMQDGCVYTATRNSFIQPFISYPADSMCINVPFSVTNKATGNGRGFFSWQFPGATLVNASNNQIEYSTAGQFDLILSYKYAQKGCYTNVTYPKAITVAGPSADFTVPIRTGCQLPFKARLINSSVSFGATNVKYLWHIYNDSTHKEVAGSPIGPTAVADSSIILKSFGEYDVALVAYSGKGCYDSIFKQSYIALARPRADFTVDNASVCLGNTINFTNATTPADDSANPYQYTWQMQNADSLGVVYSYKTTNVSFQPSIPGSYNVSLIVKNASGCMDTLRRLKYVHVNGVIASVSLTNNEGCPPFTSNFAANIQYAYPRGLRNPIKYNWAVSPNDSGVSILYPNNISTTAYITKSNTYNVILNLADNNGCMSKVYTGNQIHSGVISKFYLDSGVCLGTSISSHNTSPNNPDGYKWLGKPSNYVKFIPSDTSASPGIVFLKNTCYNISLISYKNYKGSLCVDTATSYLCTHVPKAGFSSKNTQDSCAPQIVNFNNTSVNATNFHWDFGDGETLVTTQNSISHLYKNNNSVGYSVKLIASNNSGCADTFTRNGYIKIIGPMPLFKLDKNTGCDSLTVNFTNVSKGVNDILMDYGDGSALDSFISPQHTYKINDPTKDSAIYYPTLLAIDISQCSAYHEDTIRVYRTPVANFSTNALNGCLPLKVKFTDSSLFAQKWNWDFTGNGITGATTKNPVFTYTRPGVYSITLKAVNGANCSSIKTKADYIDVFALPAVSFSLSKHKICGNGNVTFNNTSTGFSSYKINYGDGSPDDSNAADVPLSSHSYSFNTAIGGNLQTYIATLTDYNINGCSDVVSDTVTLSPRPSAGFYASQISGCAPLSVQFFDISKYAAMREWYYDNSLIPGDTAKNPVHVFSTGHHTIKLKTISELGCMDSITLTNYIEADPLPIAVFDAIDTDVCYNAPIQFTDKSITANKIIHWEWNFDEPTSSPDTSGLENPSFAFTSKGYHNVSLKVIDQLGCVSAAYNKVIYVEDTLPPVNSSIEYVTVGNSNEIKVYWNKNTYSKFYDYTLYQNGSQVISGITHSEDTVYVQADTAADHINIQPVCYNIQSGDKCGNESGLSNTQCTILLKATNNSPTSILLKWTAYTGWGTVRNYTVYRSVDSGTFSKLAILPNTALTYIDSDLCDKNYHYYIEALHPAGLYTSQSNRAGSHPNYVYQSAPLSLLSVIVSGNNSIRIKWASGVQNDIKKYAVDRLTEQGWQYNYMSTTGTQITDNNVNPNIASYGYQVRAEDDCGNSSPASNIGKSILLAAKVVHDDISLDWTGYKNGLAGSNGYSIQIMRPGHQFENVNSTPDTFYFDDSVYKNIDTAWCYRVFAVDNNTPPDTSISNISSAIIPSRIFVPNAFTPNGDGLNDVWKVSALSVYNAVGNGNLQFDVKIFDRWGALIFESNDINKGWDGMVNGKKADEGVYLYIINASGADGRKFYLKGNIELL